MLFVHAHPDDETIVTGAAIATLVATGARVTVLTCTRGEEGEVIPVELRHLDGDALAAHRETELRGAMAALGVTDHRYLGAPDARIQGRAPRRYRDSGMVWGAHGAEPRHDLAPDALCAAEFGEIAADIATVISATGAEAVVSYDATGGYGHPDHVVAGEAARHAAEVMIVPFFEIRPPGVEGDGDVVVEVSPVAERVRAALAAYRTQLTVEGDDLRMPGGQVQPIPVHERFARPSAPGTPEPPRDWRERGLVAKLVGYALMTLAGIAVGAIGTVVHQRPIGLAVSLLIAACLVVGLRVVFSSRVAAGAAALGLLLAVGVLAQRSAGGSVLIPASEPGALPAGEIWVYGTVVIVGLALAWPRLSRVGGAGTIGGVPVTKRTSTP